MQEERLLEIRQPRQGHPAWMAVSVVGVLLFAVPGMLIGMGYRYLKSTDPEGNTYYVYHEHTRWWGGWIMIASVVSALLWFGLALTT
jgi:hypothetical protein